VPSYFGILAITEMPKLGVSEAGKGIAKKPGYEEYRDTFEAIF
jgi:hypothetical protein